MREKLRVPVSRAGLKLLFALFISSFFGIASVSAQFVGPTFTESVLGGGTGAGTNPNSATIDYTSFPNGFAGPVYQLTAVVAEDPAGGAPYLYVQDGTSMPVSFQIPTISASGPYMPDVIIGNDLLNTGQYVIGIVINDGGDVYLQEYSVSGQGSGTLTVPSTPVSTTNISNSLAVVGAPHIDIITQYSTPYPAMSSYPTCDDFAIVWEEFSSVTSSDVVLGYAASLSAPTSSTTFNVFVGAGSNGTKPDVAAVERADGSGGYYNVALITLFGDPIGSLTHKVICVEHDITTNTVLPGKSFREGVFDAPRIDAIDDYHFNDTTSGGNAYYTVVTSGTPTPPIGGQTGVYAFTTINPVGFDIDTAAPIPHQTGFSDATVACGPGNVYTIDYYTTGAKNTYFSQQIGWGTGNLVIPRKWYQIPMNTVTGTTNAVSGTCNTEGSAQQLYACWDDGTGTLYQKFALLSPFSFRPAAVNTVAATADWQLSPNPASNNLYLRASGADITGATYSITDITGRVMQEAAVITASQQIQVSDLPAGMYMLNVFANGAMLKTIKFVKE